MKTVTFWKQLIGKHKTTGNLFYANRKINNASETLTLYFGGKRFEMLSIERGIV